MRPWRIPAAYSNTPASTLSEASIAKFDAACGKLDSKPGQHLLEIGTGWGGLAIHAARALWVPRHDHHHIARTVRVHP